MTGRIGHLTTLAEVAAIVFVVSLFYAVNAQAQKAVTLSAEGITAQPFTLAELGALIVERNGKLETLMVMPVDARPKAYRDVVIEERDLLLMLNGKKLASIDDLKSSYEKAQPGETLKFGVKRDDGIHIISFAKADPQDLPKMTTMMTVDDSTVAPSSGMTMSRIGAPGESGEMAFLAGSGIIANTCAGGDSVSIAALLPDAATMLNDTTVAVGDRIISVQGKAINDLETLNEVYDGIKVGETVTMVFELKGTKRTVEFTKKKPVKRGGMMMMGK